MTGRGLVLSLWVAAGGCDAGAAATAELQQAGACPKAICGYNSPEIDFEGFHELSIAPGQRNEQGFSISGFRQAGRSYRLAVVRSRFVASDGVTELSGKDLVGAEILLDHPGPYDYVIRIAEVGEMIAPFTGASIETYVLEYKRAIAGQTLDDPNLAWVNVCGGVALPGPDAWWETLGQDVLHTILIQGDRYDVTTMTTRPWAEAEWFNLGCAGHTLSKLHLTGNTLAADPWAPHAERQATLKLLVADYCGDGVPFTVAGQALVWQGGRVGYFAPPVQLEARWDEHGATCLDTPRLATPTTPEGAEQFPDIEAAIAKWCRVRPPPCQKQDPFEFDGALRVSAVP